MNDAQPQPASAGTSVEIRFENRGDKLIGLGLFNGLLKVLTLGMYSFWGKTEARRRLWSFMRLNGESLQYTGTGKELMLGFLVVLGAFVLPLFLAGMLIGLLLPGNKSALAIYQVVVYGLFFFLLGNAMYRAQRYRLSRTTWRGIRGGMDGSPWRYGWTYFWTIAIPFGAVFALAGAAAVAWPANAGIAGAIAVLGFVAALWILPWRANTLQRILTNDMRFGDRALSYTGTPGPLYKRYVFAWASSAITYVAAMGVAIAYAFNTGLTETLPQQIPPTGQQVAVFALIILVAIILAGLITAWYRANQMNHFARHTHLDTATFELTASGKGLMWLLFSNWVLAALGVLAGIVLGGALLFALTAVPGLSSAAPTALLDPSAAPEIAELEEGSLEPGVLGLAVAFAPVVVMSTVANTFALFRSARYFISRLKLNGAVALDLIQQNATTGPRRGEGLAQVFDIDAF